MENSRNKIGQREALQEGTALRFATDLIEKGFVVEFQGKFYAYENRCPHLGVELDWIPGEFFDRDKAYLVCSTHGARFQPDTGKCVSGPCVGQSLLPLPLMEQDGDLYI